MSGQGRRTHPVSRSGIDGAASTTPPRQPNSIRRTSHIDMLFDGTGGLVLDGAARDLHTTTTDRAEVVAAATIRASLGAEHVLDALETDPPDERAARLLGRIVGRGFRAAVDDVFADLHQAGSPLYLLLDDLPVAALISGYARLYRRDLVDRERDVGGIKGDICAGWRSDGTMMVSLRDNNVIPVPLGPPAPELVPPGDPLSWHTIGPLEPGAMRRRRLVEVAAGSPISVYAMFRDTHVDAGGDETVLHEYSVMARLDPSSLVLSGCVAHPHVLPWTECPAAAASAGWLDGHAVPELRALVREQFRGTSTCTHLNDLLRSLGDLAVLVPRCLS
jgi:hypothetical protein